MANSKKGDTVPSETSPLLGPSNGLTSGNAKPKSLAGNKSLFPNGTTEEVTGPVNGGASDGMVDEVGSTEEAVNPMFEGLPEAAKKMHLLLPAVGIGVFLSAADQLIIVSTYGKIGSELNALNSTSWIATSYFLTLTTIQPLSGKLSDIFGRKPVLLTAYAMFGLGCLFCGLARTMPELIAARAFAGLGGGSMTTVVSILLSDIIPLRKRGTWQGYINIIYAFGSSLGAPLGGILADGIGWRWAFIGQAPICALAFLAVYFILDLPKQERSHWTAKLAQIDFLGAFFLIMAIFSLLVGLDRGSNFAWRDNTTITCLSISVPLFVIFVYVEMRIASHPFAPGHIIFFRPLFAAYACNFFAFAGYISTIFYLPLYFQAVDSLSATSAGLRLIPTILGSVSGSVAGGLMMQKTGKYYALTLFAYSCLTLGHIPVILCSGVLVNSTPGIIAGMIICGFGGGIGVTTTLIALIANADPADQAIATACSYLFRSLGSVVGLSLSATVVQQSLRVQLRGKLGDGSEADRIVDRVRESLDFIKELDPKTKAIVQSCYQKATQGAFGFAMVVVGLAVVSAVFIREKKLSR